MARRLVGIALLVALAGCGSDGDDGAPASTPLLVLGAFPAELAALLERAEVDSTTQVADRTFRVGRIAGVPVIVGMTGIGLLNAAATTTAALEQFEVRGVVMSGVAGSYLRIGDVAVPEEWALADGSTYAADPVWLRIASRAAEAAAATLERCTMVPNEPELGLVCTEHAPAVVVGGRGMSEDSFGDRPFACVPTGGEVFGCDGQPAALAPAAASLAPSADAALISVDMESAAVARAAAARGVPFIAFRAVSDGAGDPLNKPGFPAQFFAYYRLAANNAAAATAAFLARLDR